MKEFKKFYFKSFSFDKTSLLARFNFSFDNEVFFEEILDFSSDFKLRSDLDIEVIENILFHIHISLGISYYKLYPETDLILQSGYLSDSQIVFWKNFYLNGLGEFLYKNNILPDLLFNFINDSSNKFDKIDFNVSEKSLVPIGGGKDSIVTIELLKKQNLDFDLFVFGKNDLLKENTARVANKKILFIKRSLSKNLFELNSSGYYNGHVPITGIIAFSMQLVAYLYDYKYLVLSNEYSANFSNTSWEGFEVNHQYSKSLEFEKDFKKYVNNYISSNVKYFSLLRGMYEYKIADLFSFLAKKYFSIFSSCNNNFKILDKNKVLKKGVFWCNNCPKCVFVFSILRPFLDKKEVIDIFGEDLFENKNLETLFRELLGISGIKPFECVGEAEEVILGMYKSIEKYDNKNLPYILYIFKNEVLVNLDKKILKNIEKKLVTILSDDIIPESYKKVIFKDLIDEKK